MRRGCRVLRIRIRGLVRAWRAGAASDAGAVVALVGRAQARIQRQLMTKMHNELQSSVSCHRASQVRGLQVVPSICCTHHSEVHVTHDSMPPQSDELRSQMSFENGLGCNRSKHAMLSNVMMSGHDRPSFSLCYATYMSMFAPTPVRLSRLLHPKHHTASGTSSLRL